MNLFNLLWFIWKHPMNQNNKIGAVNRFIKWQLYNLLLHYPIVYPFTERAKLLIQKGMTGATLNLYCGLDEYEDMGFLLHFLRDTDIFADVGANVGSYTMLASAHVRARSICIEPVPYTYNILKQNIALNHLEDRTVALNIGIGSASGKIKFTKSLGPMNHVAVATDMDTIDVPIDSLDNVLLNRTPCLIKIDVEGYEKEVINGAPKLLSNPVLKAIIIECGHGDRYGFDDDLVLKKIEEYGFVRYRYDPKKRRLFEGERGESNLLYFRDIDFVKERILTADKVNINNTIL